jgi:hypothetical protein
MARMPDKSKTVERMARMYRRFLWLYPAEHRRDYGGLMMQLFRDQCREALREQGAPRLFAVGWRALTDLIFSSIHEHITNLTNNMKTSGINLLSHLLIATAIGTALLANPGIVGAGPAVACVALSMLALFARAIGEWFRPAGDAWKAIGWGVLILVAYGLIMPFWAKLHVIDTDASPALTVLLTGPIFLNTIVPILRALLDRRSQLA